MQIIEILLLAIGLAMDAFAVSIITGLSITTIRPWHAIKTALFFGIFQMVMPLIGWFAGMHVIDYFEAMDHWIAFGLLTIIGVKMVWDGYSAKRNGSCPDMNSNPTATMTLLILALATSIDALAVGVSLVAFVNISIWYTVLIIGAITFILSAAGVFLGKKIGKNFQCTAQVVGGLVLFFIGLKILIEHLGA